MSHLNDCESWVFMGKSISEQSRIGPHQKSRTSSPGPEPRRYCEKDGVKDRSGSGAMMDVMSVLVVFVWYG